jgi:hypothetical protein
LSRGAILGRDAPRTLLIRRAFFVHALQLALQLPLTFPGRFEFSTLGFHLGLLFLGRSSSFFPAALLFLLLDFALPNLFLKGLQASCLGIFFFLELIFVLKSLGPVTRLVKRRIMNHRVKICLLKTLGFRLLRFLLLLDGLLTNSLLRLGLIGLLGISLARTISSGPAGWRRGGRLLACSLGSCSTRTTLLLSQTALSLGFSLSILFLGTLHALLAFSLLSLLALRQSLSGVGGLQPSSGHTLSNALLRTLPGSRHAVFVCVTRG